MLRKIGIFLSHKIEKWMPDSFVFAFLLTLLASFLALTFTPTRPLELLEHWHEGFWSMLSFTMQIVLILMLGYIVGISPPVGTFFDYLSKKIKKPTSGYLIISLVSLTLSLINWGMAPVAAVFAAEVCRRVKGIDFRLACAAVYVSFLPCQGGLSAVAPLMMNTPGNEFIKMGIVDEIIPISATLGSALNLTLLVLSFVFIPLIIIAMAPIKTEKHYDAALLWERGEGSPNNKNVNDLDSSIGKFKTRPHSLSEMLNNSRVLNYSIVALGFIYLFYHFSQTGMDGLELNSLNFAFLMLGLALHGSPMHYLKAAAEAVKGMSPLMLQFPFYAGIMGIVMHSGLSGIITDFFINISTYSTFPWLAFVAAAVVNLFIPSGGGEWMVIGPSLLSAAEGLGVSLERVVVAFSYGDTITNLINPFWTLSFLPVMVKIMDIKAREFMGYTILVSLLFFVIYSAAILLIP